MRLLFGCVDFFGEWVTPTTADINSRPVIRCNVRELENVSSFFSREIIASKRVVSDIIKSKNFIKRAMKSIHTSLPERERHTVYTALFCYVLELQLLDGSAYNKELLAQAGRKNGHSPSAQLTNLEKKKGSLSQSTRKRRVACPFHLVYQATYRYIMQPPTRVISLDSALLCSANGRYQHSTFLSIFKVAHQNHRPLSRAATSFVSLYWLRQIPTKTKDRIGYIPHLFCAPHILYSILSPG
jgi:hypothetical protein